MSERQSVECVDFCIPKLQKSLRDNTPYEITFDRPSSEYPNVLLDLFFFTMKEFVLEWIEENIPNAWFKRVFDNSISE